MFRYLNRGEVHLLPLALLELEMLDEMMVGVSWRNDFTRVYIFLN